MTRPLSRRQKYRVYNETIEQLEARYQCATCTDVIEHDDAIYCRYCRTYWEDVANGLFDRYHCKNCGDLITDGHTQFCGMCREMGCGQSNLPHEIQPEEKP